MWEVVRKYENQPFVQISAHKEIHALTKSILQLYETLPLLVTNSNIPNGDIFCDSIYEDTTSKYSDLSAWLNNLYSCDDCIFGIFSSNDLYGCIDLQRISDIVCLRHTIEMKQS